MLSKFKKAIDITLIGIINTNCFFDGTTNVTGGTLDEHLSLVKKGLKKFDDENLRLKFSKCSFAEHEIEWLGYIFSKRCIRPLEKKTSVILNPNLPNT